WERRHAAERAKRADDHRVAELAQQRQVAGLVLAAPNAIDDFDAARRADTARRALAARLDRAELHREARLLAHIHRVVEHDEAAMADHRADGRELFVVERRVEMLR